MLMDECIHVTVIYVMCVYGCACVILPVPLDPIHIASPANIFLVMLIVMSYLCVGNETCGLG